MYDYGISNTRAPRIGIAEKVPLAQSGIGLNAHNAAPSASLTREERWITMVFMTITAMVGASLFALC